MRANENLRIVTAMDILRNRAQAFVAVYQDGEVHILDDLSDTVLTQEFARYFVPTYSVNETTRWAHIIVPATASSAREN